MKAIVCGAGQVGTVIAKYLSDESYKVILIDTDGKKLSTLDSSMDIQTVQGSASNPNVLETAGAKEADLMIAVTGDDEVNMIACLAADSLFNIPTKICRIRSGFYLDPDYEKFLDALHTDVIISPEQEIARKIVRNLKIPGALDLISLNDGKAYMIGLPCLEGAPLIGRHVDEIKELLPDHVIALGRIMRHGKSIPITAKTTFNVDDDVYFVTRAKGMNKVIELFGHESDRARNVIIFGGGRVGFMTARLLEHEGMASKITLVEKNEARATYLAKQLPETLVIKGDGVNEEILNECRLCDVDVAIALTGEDEDNILLSLLAKRKDVRKTFALVNKPIYNSVISDLGVDVIIDPNAVSISTIIGHIRKGQIKAVYSLGADVGDMMEVTALETSKIVDVPFSKIKQPAGVKIGAVIRDGELLTPSKDFEIKKDDSVIVFSQQGNSKDVDKLFAAGLFFF